MLTRASYDHIVCFFVFTIPKALFCEHAIPLISIDHCLPARWYRKPKLIRQKTRVLGKFYVDLGTKQIYHHCANNNINQASAGRLEALRVYSHTIAQTFSLHIMRVISGASGKGGVFCGRPEPTMASGHHEDLVDYPHCAAIAKASKSARFGRFATI
jgi:DNA-binding cell septation regulator SpoVG